MMSMNDGEWIRLPGLFRWSEVCDVFGRGSGHDEEWRFVVTLEPAASVSEPLYVVHAATGFMKYGPRRATPRASGSEQHQGIPCEDPAEECG